MLLLTLPLLSVLFLSGQEPSSTALVPRDGDHTKGCQSIQSLTLVFDSPLVTLVMWLCPFPPCIFSRGWYVSEFLQKGVWKSLDPPSPHSGSVQSLSTKLSTTYSTWRRLHGTKWHLTLRCVVLPAVSSPYDDKIPNAIKALKKPCCPMAPTDPQVHLTSVK